MTLQSKALMLLAGVFLAGGLSACITSQDNDEASALAQQKASCLEAGGRWGRGGILGLEQCFPSYSDGGKSCNRDSDCQGMCLADTRSCAKSFSYGCQSYLNDDGVVEEICID